MDSAAEAGFLYMKTEFNSPVVRTTTKLQAREREIPVPATAAPKIAPRPPKLFVSLHVNYVIFRTPWCGLGKRRGEGLDYTLSGFLKVHSLNVRGEMEMSNCSLRCPMDLRVSPRSVG